MRGPDGGVNPPLLDITTLRVTVDIPLLKRTTCLTGVVSTRAGSKRNREIVASTASANTGSVLATRRMVDISGTPIVSTTNSKSAR